MQLKTAFVLSLGLMVTATLEAAEDPPWYRHALVGMEVGPTGAQSGADPADTTYAARFDGGEIVRRCAAAGVEYVVMWARDGEYAYYDSKLAPKCPGLGSRDPLREAVDAAAQQKLPVIAYCVVQQGGHHLSEHPDMAMRGPDGALIGRYCLRSAAYLELVKRMTTEMLTYGIAGFHIDMLDQGFGPPYGCWCPTCRTAFEAEFHEPMPSGPTWDAAWAKMLEFRYASSQRFEVALRDHIKSVKPTATVDFNYHGNPPFSWEVGQRPVQHAGNGDFVTGETGIWGFSALGVGLNAEFYRAATPGLPVQVAMSRQARIYHDQTIRPVADMQWELATLLAHNTFVTMIDKTAFDGSLDPQAYRAIGEAFGRVKPLRESFGHEPIQDVAIFFSTRSRDWYGKDDPPRYFSGFQGAHAAMVLEHIPWGVALDENATAESLARFPVVIVPDAPVLGDDDMKTLTAYVEQGGKLIVTGWTGTMGGLGEPLTATKIESLIGARLVRRLDTRDNSVKFPPAGDALADGVRGDLPPDWAFLVDGPALVYEPTTAKPVGQLIRPHRTLRQQRGEEGTWIPMSGAEAVGPALLVNQVGKGTVITFATSPDHGWASEFHTVEARKLLANAVRWLLPEPRLRIEAPAHVEAVATEDAAHRIRVHLIAYAPVPVTTPDRNRPFILPGLIEDEPMYRVRLSVPGSIREARAAGSLTHVEVKSGRVEALVSGIHEVITIER